MEILLKPRCYSPCKQKNCLLIVFKASLSYIQQFLRYTNRETDYFLLHLILLILLLIFVCKIRSESLQDSHSRNSLRILDINVWSGLDYKGYIMMGEYETESVREKRFQALVAQIQELNPDVIGIHEANKLPDYAERLSAILGYKVFYHVGLGGVRLGPIGLPWNLREGDAILTKEDLNPQFAGRKQLSGGYVGDWATFHFSDATQILAVKIIHQNKTFYIFATHWHASLPDSPEILEKAKELYEAGEVSEKEYQKVLSQIKEGVDWRLSESEKTLEFIQNTARDHPFILMGDFNAELGSQEITNLLQFGMVDVYQIANQDSSGFTWDPKTNLNQITHYLRKETQEGHLDLYYILEKLHNATPKRIDYIFLGPASILTSQKISIKSSKVVMKKIIDGVHASDHYGIFAEIEFDE